MMGVVYRGYDPVLDREVALKTVDLPETLPDAERESFLERFLLEARIAGKLTHPNIVVTFDAATDEAAGTPFIAMELIEGMSLDDLLERKDRLPWQMAVKIGIALAEALGHAHESGIVHRDIKPANILLTQDGTPKIADFGIAKLPTANLTKTGVVIGTPYFMSPEQLQGEELDGRSDIFSLGALLYNALVGYRPFNGTEIATIAGQILYKDPPPLSDRIKDIPSTLDGVLARAMAKPVGDRYRTADEFAAELRAVQKGKQPKRPLAPAEKTRAAGVSELPIPSRETAETIEPQAVAVEGKITGRAKGPRFSKRHGVLGVAALALLVIATGALVNRDEISQSIQLHGARDAVERGELEAGETELEELLDTNPEYDDANELLTEVSADLLEPTLPLEFSARHEHRIGHCTGKLILHDWGIEYVSKKHGVWSWKFNHLRAMERPTPSTLHLETSDEELMGLLKSKNYNFNLLSGRLEDEVWKRYRRLAH
jgi:serine/threonine protein kinase